MQRRAASVRAVFTTENAVKEQFFEKVFNQNKWKKYKQEKNYPELKHFQDYGS